MPALDDARFEQYLKQFRPVAIELLPAQTRQRAPRRSFIFVARAAAFACVLVGLGLALHFDAKTKQSGNRPESKTLVENVSAQRPLTVGRVNTLLAESPSVKSVLDRLAFHSQSTQQGNGKRSALDVLSEEKNKL